MTVIIFLIVLALLIFVHELGHFLVARACGIRVDAFALGFGPKLFSKTVGETTYSLNLIPFGGYVKIFGENPDDESLNGEDKARSFVYKSSLEKIAVLFAGIFFNFVFACILVAVAFTIGAPTSIDSYPQYKDRMVDKNIVVIAIEKDSPAEKAGLKVGDSLLFNSTSEVKDLINSSKGNGVELSYKRGGFVATTTIVAREGIVKDKFAIGISMDNVATLKLPINHAIVESFKFTTHAISETFVGIYSLIAGIFDGSSKLSSVTGPVGIAGVVGDAAKLGFTYLIMFTAIISINLGALNALPFPALDGGRVLFVVIEFIIRRPIKPAISNIINALGFGLLIIFMIIITYRDIANLFVK